MTDGYYSVKDGRMYVIPVSHAKYKAVLYPSIFDFAGVVAPVKDECKMLSDSDITSLLSGYWMNCTDGNTVVFSRDGYLIAMPYYWDLGVLTRYLEGEMDWQFLKNHPYINVPPLKVNLDMDYLFSDGRCKYGLSGFNMACFKLGDGSVRYMFVDAGSGKGI